MQRVGPYEIPFPYAPYPLQAHAMTALRSFLEGTTDNNSNNGIHVSTATSRMSTIAVLESPTGTGKSQMLLNGVLSYLFEPVCPTELLVRARVKTVIGPSTIEKEDTTSISRDYNSKKDNAAAVSTLEGVLNQRQLEEETHALRQERKAWVRAQRRKLRKARKLNQLQQRQKSSQQQHEEEAGEEYLLTQDPIAWYAEQRASSSAATMDVSSSSSSCSASSSDTCDDDDDEDDSNSDAEGALEGHLATLIPLRKPKVYFASRTHTQLQQLMEDLQRTAFAHFPLRVREVEVSRVATQDSNVDLSTTSITEKKGNGSNHHIKKDYHHGTSSLHRLSAVHVAGRPHLCLNARVQRKAGSAGGASSSSNSSGELLNFYCREAMRYERSKQGRADRRRRQHQQQQQSLTSANSIFPDEEDKMKRTRSSVGVVADMEDYASPFSGHLFSSSNGNKKNEGANEDEDEGEDKGCVFCAESHLRALLEFITAEQRAQQRADTHENDEGVNDHSDHTVSPPHTPSTSIYTMERLRHLGRELQACPYLATRLLLRGADVAFIPYSYLLDEGQRAVLLGGVTTNPATAAEAEAIGLNNVDDLRQDVSTMNPLSSSSVVHGVDGDNRDPDTLRNESGTTACTLSPPTVSLGSVLYHRRQRVTATAAFHQRHKQQQRQQKEKGKNSKTNKDDDVDDVWHALARTAPPSLRRDILVFDEAHNIADHCRTASTVTITPWHLQLTESLFYTYLSCYESRLLTRNKQRLRELIRFLHKLSQFCADASTATATTTTTTTAMASQKGSITRITTPESQVFPFHTFLFEAGIDSVDVYSLLMFLVDSQLLMKLQGFVGYCLEREKGNAEVTEVSRGKLRKNGIESSSSVIPSTALKGLKRRRPGTAEDDNDRRSDEPQRQRLLLASLSSVSTKLHDSTPACDAQTSHANRPTSGTFYSLLAPSGPSRTSVSLSSSLNAPALANGAGAPLDVTRQRAVAAEALQRVERLLCVLYVSDAVSTRVIWTPSSSSSSSISDTGPSRYGVLKFIQLEPGAHTFTPLAREAQAVVLAGGTMQPLALTCGPLFSIRGNNNSSLQRERGISTAYAPCRTSPRKLSATQQGDSKACEENPASHNTIKVASSTVESSVELSVRLISEGHVVPPTSVRVFTLGTGPSAVRLEFTQHLLGDRKKIPAPSETVTTAKSVDAASLADRMLAEVGCTLLNLVRVLPPAGAICFFTAYEMMTRTVEVLQQTGYYGQINEVKRIFCETRSSQSGSNSNHSSNDDSGGVAAMLQQYQNWIFGEDHGTSSPASSLDIKSKARKAVRRGALLFAVMSGRLSEGINFADDLGRAVIVLGMPYANPTDVELQLNLHHIASTRLRAMGEDNTLSDDDGSFCDSGLNARSTTSSTALSRHASLSSSPSPFTKAAEWGLYMDGMMRTVNQCIGRCIRHSGDYAVIILLDARYGERADVRRRVAAWLQPSLQVCRTFGECFAGVRTFFAERRAAQE